MKTWLVHKLGTTTITGHQCGGDIPSGAITDSWERLADTFSLMEERKSDD